MAYKNILVKEEKNIGWIVVNRPEKLNSLNAQTIKELYSGFLSFREKQEVKIIILTGAGDKAFIAGADISELVNLDYNKGKDYALEGQELTKLIENYPKPVIAAVNGYALGGGTEMALACHLRIASEQAKFGQPEVKLGLIPGFGGTQRLARLIGKGKAMELILSGRLISAEEAFQVGLVNRVVPHQELSTVVVQLAEEIIANAPYALQLAIRAINQGLDKSLEDGLLLEAELFGKSCATEDSQEGTKAFLEKRKPNFKGQ
ncbi:MAG TPA: enoyl-CoA hydratase [Candidatus Aminicenantes bacterium]|nr:enoyl-CoA hydratase [Candidatus Aminicenantes bacterium]